MNDLIIVGAGGVGQYVAEQLSTVAVWQQAWHVLGFVDDAPELHGETVGDLEVLGSLGTLDLLDPTEICAVVVAIASPQQKCRIVQRLHRLNNLIYPSLVHPRAWVAQSATIGKGVLVYPGTNVNHHVHIGDFATVNMGCVLGHDVQVGHYCFVAPNVALAGHVVLETGVEFGIGACAIQNCRVGAWARVGAGAVVTGDVPEQTTVVGVPARPIRTPVL